MLTSQFLGLNLYFAVNVLAALVAFAVFWLIFDAWTVRPSRTEGLKAAGFLVLAIGFLLRAASLHSQAGVVAQTTSDVANILRALGYAAIALSTFLEPLQLKPVVEPILPELPPEPEPTPGAATGPTKVVVEKAAKGRNLRKHSHGFFMTPIAGLVLPVLTGLVAGLYWRRATAGLERHLRPVAYAFAGLTLFELASLPAASDNIANPTLFQLVATYGPLWWLSLAALFVSALILGAWVWQYLVERIQSQLFIMLVAQTLVIYLCSTIAFTFLLLRNEQSQALSDLTTASHVLGYAVTSLQNETAAQAEAVAENPGVVSGLATHSHDALASALSGFLAGHELSTLVITDANAQVMLRGQDPSLWGDSLSSDPLVRRSLVGESSSSVQVSGGVVAPAVTLAAALPIRDASGNIVGSVTAGRAITGSFVDGIRTTTGLDTAVYGGSIRAATTLVEADGTRAVGIKETNPSILETVLTRGKNFAGEDTFQNRGYLTAFTPLVDVDNTPVGMLLVARPADALYAAAGQAVQLTFLFVVALILLSIYPIYLVSRYLERQLK